MKLNYGKTTILTAVAIACLAPGLASAQRYRDRDRLNLNEEVTQTFRDSKDFRHYFEHNFRANGHEPRWDASDRYGHPEHEGRFGQMTLKDAIQNLDEDIERLRAEYAHHGPDRAARDLAREIQDHSNQVENRIGRVGDWYRFEGESRWRYERSELYSRWQDLRQDIRNMTNDMIDRRD